MAEHGFNLIWRAEQLIDIDRYPEAVELLAKALASDPEDYRANVLMALTQLRLNRLENAERFINTAIQTNPDDEWAHRIKSLIFSAMGRKLDALRSAEEAVRLEPDEPYALHTLANAQLELRRSKQAKRTAEHMREIAPEMELSHLLTGNVYLADADNFSAERAFTKALEINPNSAGARNNLGVAILRQDETRSRSMFASISPWVNTKKNSDVADSHFHEALKIEPNNLLAGENMRFSHSFLMPFVFLIAFIPIVLFSFPVLPLGSVLTYLIAIYTAITTVFDVWRKRRRLSPELLAFVRSKSFFGAEGQLADFAEHYVEHYLPDVEASPAGILCILDNGGQACLTVTAISAFRDHKCNRIRFNDRSFYLVDIGNASGPRWVNRLVLQPARQPGLNRPPAS